jgi:hypothetical protein
MRGRTRIRLLAAAAVVAAATVALGANPALAADDGDSSTWTSVGGSSMSCAVGPATTTGWTCQTPSAPIVASGLTCIQTVHVDHQPISVTVPLTGCTASLLIPSGGWPGTSLCGDGSPVATGCQGAMAAGLAYFSFQPVLGSSFVDEIASITDAACTNVGGQATVTATGFDSSSGNAFSMQSTISWVGSCATVSVLTWTGTLTVA